MSEAKPLMAGKRGLIMGVANERSLACGIAKAVRAQGAELAFTFQGEALGKRVRPLAESIGSDMVIECDVTNEVSLDDTFAMLATSWVRLDFIVPANAISGGPVKTLAASGIGDFRYILKWNQYNAPLKRNITIEDVGGAGVYLLSNLSSGVTGEVHHVDCGYHVVGMKAADAPDISAV